MIAAARELTARLAGAWPRWREPHPAGQAHAELVAVLAELVEAEASRPKPVAPRPEPADPTPPMTDPSVGDKPYAGFLPPHLDKKGPFGHVPGCWCGPGQTAPSATCGMPAWAALADEERA